MTYNVSSGTLNYTIPISIMIFLLSLRFAVVAGILAKKAVEAGLAVKSFIKTSLSPGSGVVTYYLKESGVLEFMEKLGLVATYCW